MAISTLTLRPCTGRITQTRATAVAPFSRAASIRLRVAPIMAFRDDTRSMPKAVNKMTKSTKMSAAIDKQPIVPSLGHAPTNARENAESILWFVLVGGFFLTGVLFVTIPVMQVGGHAFTRTWQTGVNKTVGIKPPTINGKSYAPGPGPAAAPDSAAVGAPVCLQWSHK